VEQKAIEQAIQSVRDFYEQQGIFMKTFGFGSKPALLIIDMAYGWTDPEYATGSQRLDEAVTGINRLLPVCRNAGVPIIYTTYPAPRNGEEPMHATDEARTRFTPWDQHACEIDDRLVPHPDGICSTSTRSSVMWFQRTMSSPIFLRSQQIAERASPRMT
jgi:isochorismate hydrolase